MNCIDSFTMRPMALVIHVVLLTMTSCAPRRPNAADPEVEWLPEVALSIINEVQPTSGSGRGGGGAEAEVFHLVINAERKQRSVFILPDANWLRRLIPHVVDVADKSVDRIEDVVQASVDDPLRVNVIKTEVMDEQELPETMRRINDMLRLKNFRSDGSSGRAGSPKKVLRTLNIIIYNLIRQQEAKATFTSAPEVNQSIPFIQRPPTAMEKEYFNPQKPEEPEELEEQEVEISVASGSQHSGIEEEESLSELAKPLVIRLMRKGMDLRNKLVTSAGVAIGSWLPAFGKRKRSVPEAEESGRVIDEKWLDILMGKKYSNASGAELKASVDNWKFRGENRTSGTSGRETTSARSPQASTPFNSESRIGSYQLNIEPEVEPELIAEVEPEVKPELIAEVKPEASTAAAEEEEAKLEVNTEVNSGRTDSSGADYDIVNNFLKVTLETLDDGFDFTQMPESDAYAIRKTPGEVTGSGGSSGSVTNSPITYVSLNPLYPPEYVSLLYDRMNSGGSTQPEPEVAVTSAPVTSTTSTLAGMYSLDIPSPLDTNFATSGASGASGSSTEATRGSTSAGGTSSLVSDAITNQQLLELLLSNVNSESTTSAGWSSTTGSKPTTTGLGSSTRYKPPGGWSSASAGYKPFGWTVTEASTTTTEKPSGGSWWASGGSRPEVAANVAESAESWYTNPPQRPPQEPESGIAEVLDALAIHTVPSEPETGLAGYEPETGDPIEPEAPLKAGIGGLVGVSHPSAGIHFLNSSSNVIELDPFNSSTWSPFSIQPLPIEAALLEHPADAFSAGASLTSLASLADDSQEAEVVEAQTDGSQVAPVSLSSQPDVNSNAYFLLPGSISGLSPHGIVAQPSGENLAGKTKFNSIQFNT